MFKFLKKLFKSTSSSSESTVEASSYSERTKYFNREQTILNSLRDVTVARQRIRAEYNNNFSLSAAINSVSRLAVGTRGISVIFSPKKNSQRQTKLIDSVQSEWQEWVGSNLCDTEKSSNLMNLQLQIANTVRIDGFVFFEIIRDLKGIYIKTHSADRLADSLHRDLEDGNYIRFGVEYNPQRIKIAYHFRQQDEIKRYLYGGGYTGDDYVNTTRYSVDQMMMCYLPDRAGMPFGLPSMLSSFLITRSVKTYQDAELQKQSIASAITGFITSDLDEEDSPFSDIQKRARSLSSENNDIQRSSDVLDLPISSMERLREGEKVTFPENPNTDAYAAFIDSNLGSIAMAQGITREFYMGDFSKASYSSSRMAASINALPTSALRNNVLQSQFLNKIIPEFLDHLHLSKDFPSDIFKFHWDYLAASMPAVDPVKQAKADEIDFNLGVKSMTTIMIDRGLNPEKEFERIKNEKEKYPDIFAAKKPVTEENTAENENIENNTEEQEELNE